MVGGNVNDSRARGERGEGIRRQVELSMRWMKCSFKKYRTSERTHEFHTVPLTHFCSQTDRTFVYWSRNSMLCF